MADFLDNTIGATVFGLPVGTPTFQNHTLDAADDAIAFAFAAYSTSPITKVWVRYGTRTGTPPTYIAGIESLSASTGLPDGTIVGGGSPASVAFTPPADTTWNSLGRWLTLANSYTPTQGELLALTVRYSSGTINGSNNSAFTTGVSNLASGTNSQFPYNMRETAGAWVKSGQASVFGIQTAASRHGPLIEAVFSTRTASTVGLRRAMEFSMPSGSCSSFTVKGLRFAGSLAAGALSGKSPVVAIWDASGVVQSVVVDSDALMNPATATGGHEILFTGSLPNLAPGTTYYAGPEVADAASAGVVLYGFSVTEADDLIAHSGKTAFRMASYDGSSWTPDPLTRPFMELILGDVTGGGGSGGGYPILMAGGIVR